MSQVTEPMPEIETWMEYEIERLEFKYRSWRVVAEVVADRWPDSHTIVVRLEIDGREFGIAQTLAKSLDKLSFLHFFLMLERRIEMAIEDGGNHGGLLLSHSLDRVK